MELTWSKEKKKASFQHTLTFNARLGLGANITVGKTVVFQATINLLVVELSYFIIKVPVKA